MDPAQQALASARKHLQRGDFPAAIRCCESVLAVDPDHGEALELSGLAHVNSGSPAEGIARLRRAVTRPEDRAGSTANLAVALARNGEPAEAASLLRAALERHGDSPDLHFNLAVVLQAAKDTAGAEMSYRHCVRLEPGFAEAHNNLGLILHRQARYPDAVEAFRRALAIRPGYLRALTNLGNAQRKMGQYAAAADTLTQALAQGPGHVPTLCNLAQLRFEQEDFRAAATLFERAVAAQPTLALARIGQARSLAAQERHTEALTVYDQALALEPTAAEAWNARGLSLVRLGRHVEAIDSYERALNLSPDYASAAWNQALARLTLRDFKSGWPLFEARFRVEGLQAAVRTFAMPQWRGESPVAGATIWVHAEYGLGDTLQFCRYLPLLADRGARVVFEVPRSLHRLLETLPGPIDLIDTGQAVATADWHCPLLSLPLAFDTDAHDIPSPVPYLAADPAAVTRWAARLAGRGGLRVGIAWKGNGEADKRGLQGRSIPLDVFRTLLRVPGVCLYSLQKDAAVEELAAAALGDRLVHFGEDLDAGGDAFVDTAALMTLMDVVVTLDTSVAHLAGALGVPVWLGLHTQADWRWHLDCDASPWYPNIRLYRQTVAGDWQGVFDTMADQLALPCAGSRPAAPAVTKI